MYDTKLIEKLSGHKRQTLLSLIMSSRRESSSFQQSNEISLIIESDEFLISLLNKRLDLFN